MHAKWWLISVAALVVVAGGLMLRRKPEPAPPTHNPGAAVVETSNEATLRGKIRPQHVLRVAAGVPGVIEAFLVEPGQDVFEGQVLARIGSQGLESTREGAANELERAQDLVNRADTALNGARMEQSRAEADAQRSRLALERAEKTFNRQQMLHGQGATPRLAFEKAQAEYQAAQKDFEIMDAAARANRERVTAAQKDTANARKTVEDKRGLLEDAQQELAAAEVHSPVEGYVVSHEGEVGHSAQELGDRVFTIATDLDAPDVLLEPKADLLKRIIPGMPATAVVLDLDGAAFQGTVKEIREKENQVIVE